ncbi:hypothetical protein SUGI_0596340 [Cryptomeria japonica]|nr:hypothetical protein SUGI_0596340 [Cryptomeria japonica]
MSNLTSASGEASISSDTRGDVNNMAVQPAANNSSNATTVSAQKRKRSLPGTPDPDAEVIALSPRTLMTTNRFICEICNKGFQRDQNLQLHRRGHNLPWKLKQRSSKEIRKRVYICPEESCVHHDPARALGDLTGVKKHFCRKHGEKKWKCDKCSKRYAVQSDWKAHSKTCGTREYRCDCGTLFSRRDSFITHRAFCDALAEESARMSAGITVADGHVPESNLLGGAAGHMSVIRGAAAAAATASSSPSLQHQFSFPMRPSSRIPETNLLNPRWDATSRSGLSLWVGQAPENSHHMTGGHQFGSMDVNPFAPSPKNMQSMLGLSDYDDSPAGKAGNLSALLPNPAALYSNIFSNTADHFGVANWADRSGSAQAQPQAQSAARLSLSTSATLTTSTSNNVNTDNSSLYSSTNENNSAQQNPYMSATALLQKAAQMGATAGNPPMFSAFGMAGSDTGSHHVGLGLSWPDSANQHRMVSGLDHHGGAGGGAYFVGSALNGLPFGGDSTTSYGAAGTRIMSDNNQPSVRQSPLGARNQAQQMMQRRLSAGHGVLGAGNLKDGGDGLTRDFLGVGGPAEELGRTLNIASLSSGIDLVPYKRENSLSHTVGTANTGFSPPKSWDAS